MAVDANLQFPKHDFTHGYKVIPFGILVAEMPPYSTRLDVHGKERVKPPTNWTLYVALRFNKLAGKEKPVSYSDHREDLNYVAQHHWGGAEVPADWKIDSDMGSESNYYTDKALLGLADVFEENLLGSGYGVTAGRSDGNTIEAFCHL